MKKLFILLAAFSAVSCMAQNVPAEVSGAFNKSFPNTTVKKWDKEDGNYEANFSKDNKIMSATFDAKGNWLETEQDIKISELPPSVASYVKTKYNASIKEAAIISNPQTKKMYEAEVKGKDLLFDESGKFLKEEAD